MVTNNENRGSACRTPDNFGMFSFSWLPTMRTEEVLAAPEEVLAAPDKFGIEEIYPTASNGSVWY